MPFNKDEMQFVKVPFSVDEKFNKTVTIDGVDIIKDVCMAYFNKQSGRDSYLNPIWIQPGSTMEVTMTPTEIVPGGGIAPALETTVLNVDFYFGRTKDVENVI